MLLILWGVASYCADFRKEKWAEVEVARELASFVVKSGFTDLPEQIVCEMKRVLLDSIGCAIGGLMTERGKIVVKLARRLGGPQEATVIATNDKVSCANAALANGELTNALEFDALSRAGRHDAPIIIPAALALAESVHASGEDLILAIALGLEISGRLKLAVGGISTPIAEGPEKGKIRWPRVHGFSVITLGAAASAGKILTLNQKEMANALGLAGCLCPPSIVRKWMETTPITMSKYGPCGWAAHVGVISALLAGAGYTADTGLFNSEFGFWTYTGKAKGEWNMEPVLEGLGAKWHCHQICYKQYPCGDCLISLPEMLLQIMEENHLQPDDIERIKAQPHPVAQFTAWRENALTTPDDYCFNARYLLACAAQKIEPTYWHDPNIQRNPKIQEFLQRVEFAIIIDEKDFGLARLEDSSAWQMRIEVVAKGKSFRKKASYVRGASWLPEEFRITDDELIKKFGDNASRVLPSDKVNKVTRAILGIEKMKNVNELMKMLAS